MDNQFERISYDLTQEIEYAIENTIGEKASEEEKANFVDSLLNIFQNQSKKFLKKFVFQNYESSRTPFQNTSTNFNNATQVNIIFSPMPNFPQNIQYSQMPISYMMPQKSYFSYQPYQQLQNPIYMRPIPYLNQIPQRPLVSNQLTPSFNRSPAKKPKSKSKFENISETKKQEKNSNSKAIEKVEPQMPKAKANIKSEFQIQNSKTIEKVESHIQNSEANKSENASSDSAFKVINCPNGILSYLMAQIGQTSQPPQTETSAWGRGGVPWGSRVSPPNIHDNGTICISANSVCDGHPKDVLFGSHSFLTLPEHRNVWIMFDFKLMEVKITSYSITCGPIIGIIRNWSLETSPDGRNWNKIDQHFNDNSLNCSDIKQTFAVNSDSSFARYARISFTDIESEKIMNNNYAITIKAIEFYGDLKCH